MINFEQIPVINTILLAMCLSSVSLVLAPVLTKYFYLLGCEILGGTDGIHFTYVRDGRPSGEAYVELANSESLTHALSKDQNNLGKRYIEGNEVQRIYHVTSYL